jgi:hypothetical protein
MRHGGRTLVGTALGAVVVSFLVVVSTPGPASALPAVCASGAPKVVTWTHNSGTAQNWDTPNNWNPIGVPSPDAIACINTTDTVVIGPSIPNITADQVHLAGTTVLRVPAGRSLLVNGAAESVWAPGTTVEVPMGELGGSGTIRAQGNVTFTSGQFGTFLTTTHNGGGQQPPADAGQLVVEGHATLANLGLALSTGYGVSVANGGVVTMAPDTWFAADYGTALTVQPGGTLELAGDGDYHQGFAVAGQPLSVLTNNGLLTKTAGAGTSVVDATYAGSGQAAVLSGTLALPDNQQVGASVSPGTSLATGRCEGVGASCVATVDPAKDTMSVAFAVPGSNAGPAAVQLQELGPVSPAVDPAGVGNEVLAHAENLTAGQAARIDLRFSQSDVMGTPLDQVQVVHQTDTGFDVLLPDCVNGTLPAGLYSCVVRPATRTAENTFVSVLTTTTSRWRVRRGQAVENQGAPSAPQGLVVKEAAPFDGSAHTVTWAAPASSGAGPVAAYRVRLDGALVSSPAGTSVVLEDPGPGEHTITVAAVSAAGQGPTTTATATVAGLSKPRKVNEVQGKKGGKLTAGARWKAPADAGGLAISKYKLAVFKADGTKVDTEVVKAGKVRYLFTLKPGRYFLKVKARNADRWGPWSKKTDLVRPR